MSQNQTISKMETTQITMAQQTAKEKAYQLINKYNLVVLDTALGGSNSRVKKCALIAVDEILSVIDRDANYQNVYAYFLEVKQEIEKL